MCLGSLAASPKDVSELNTIDQQLTEFMISAEKLCAKKHKNRQPWSPKLHNIGKTFADWKQKNKMSSKKLFHWEHLSQLHFNSSVTDDEHYNTDPSFIKSMLKTAHSKWRQCKKRSITLRRQFLQGRAKFLASKMCTTEEKALKAIIQAERSRHTYSIIQELIRKQKMPLTQVDVLNASHDTVAPHITLKSKEEIEQAILS
jgi:hypothetical protein